MSGGQTKQRQAAHGARESSHARTLGLLVRGKNIHEDTLLATDYLNHFNEVIMLIGMIPDMPECLEDAKTWAPKSYEEHFRDSSFVDKELAILAYQNAPPRYRVPFDNTIAQMNDMVAAGMSRIETALAQGHPEQVTHAVANVTRNLQRFVDTASAIIHGAEQTMDQVEIDNMLKS